MTEKNEAKRLKFFSCKASLYLPNAIANTGPSAASAYNLLVANSGGSGTERSRQEQQ